jgi:hypothetical protein
MAYGLILLKVLMSEDRQTVTKELKLGTLLSRTIEKRLNFWSLHK